MKFSYALPIVLALSSQAVAQPPREAAPTAERQARREQQRRAELREALQAPPRQTGEPRETGRHLSDQERAELRRQLRQQPQGEGRQRQ